MFGLRQIIAATFATQLTVLPLLLYQVGSVSLVAPLVNVLVLPFVPFVMALGFVAGLIGVLNIVLAIPFALLAYAILAYTFWIVSLFSTLPFAAITLPVMPFWFLLVLYAGIGAVCVYAIKNTRANSGV
jgi:competence protein ComEC